MVLLLPAVCLHPPHWWRMPWNGKWRWASHSPLRGRQWMVPAWEWQHKMLRWGPPTGPYISRSAAAYPADVNRVLAESWIAGAVFCRIQETQASSMVRSGWWGNSLVRMGKQQSDSRKRKFSEIDGIALDTPKVVMARPLRHTPTETLPPLMDESLCVCVCVVWSIRGKPQSGYMATVERGLGLQK